MDATISMLSSIDKNAGGGQTLVTRAPPGGCIAVMEVAASHHAAKAHGQHIWFGPAPHAILPVVLATMDAAIALSSSIDKLARGGHALPTRAQLSSHLAVVERASSQSVANAPAPHVRVGIAPGTYFSVVHHHWWGWWPCARSGQIRSGAVAEAVAPFANVAEAVALGALFAFLNTLFAFVHIGR